jgi:hypothetical protein
MSRRTSAKWRVVGLLVLLGLVAGVIASTVWLIASRGLDGIQGTDFGPAAYVFVVVGGLLVGTLVGLAGGAGYSIGIAIDSRKGGGSRPSLRGSGGALLGAAAASLALVWPLTSWNPWVVAIGAGVGAGLAARLLERKPEPAGS